MSYFGLFVELPKKFETFIYEEKNKIKNFSINEFVDHPPHITLATFSEPYKEIFEEISFKPTQILVQQKKYFTDENSNFTLYYDIKPDSSLIDLHHQVVDRLDKKNNNLLYTYIKSDWIPHITIGQIRDKKYAEQFANEKYKIEIFLNRLSYIKYENKKHITLKEKKYC
jgi:2'-5' RNA ligase